MRREEQIVGAILGEQDIGGLNKGTISIVNVEDFHWLSDGCDTIPLQLLQKNWNRYKWLLTIVAVAAMSNTVSVPLVDHVQRAVGVSERRWVDGTTMLVGTGEWLVFGDIRT